MQSAENKVDNIFRVEIFRIRSDMLATIETALKTNSRNSLKPGYELGKIINYRHYTISNHLLALRSQIKLSQYVGKNTEL